MSFRSPSASLKSGVRGIAEAADRILSGTKRKKQSGSFQDTSGAKVPSLG